MTHPRLTSAGKLSRPVLGLEGKSVRLPDAAPTSAEVGATRVREAFSVLAQAVQSLLDQNSNPGGWVSARCSGSFRVFLTSRYTATKRSAILSKMRKVTAWLWSYGDQQKVQMRSLLYPVRQSHLLHPPPSQTGPDQAGRLESISVLGDRLYARLGP